MRPGERRPRQTGSAFLHGGYSMHAETMLREGHLSAAIALLKRQVKTSPTDAQRRTFLFELQSFAGDYARADHQLAVLRRLGKATTVGVKVYRGHLMAEEARRRLFTH